MRFHTVSLSNGTQYQSVGGTDAEAIAKIKFNMSKFPRDLASSVDWESEGDQDLPGGPGRNIKTYCPVKQ